MKRGEGHIFNLHSPPVCLLSRGSLASVVKRCNLGWDNTFSCGMIMLQCCNMLLMQLLGLWKQAVAVCCCHLQWFLLPFYSNPAEILLLLLLRCVVMFPGGSGAMGVADWTQVGQEMTGLDKQVGGARRERAGGGRGGQGVKGRGGGG